MNNKQESASLLTLSLTEISSGAEPVLRHSCISNKHCFLIISIEINISLVWIDLAAAVGCWWI